MARNDFWWNTYHYIGYGVICVLAPFFWLMAVVTDLFNAARGRNR